MARYVYPAFLSSDETGSYAIHFPDLPNCFTQGDDIVQKADLNFSSVLQEALAEKLRVSL